MNKTQMLNRMLDAFKTGKLFVVAVKAPNQAEPELIINANGNLLNKVSYYGNAYNDELKLNNCKDIEIIAYASGENEIEAISNIKYMLEDIC